MPDTKHEVTDIMVNVAIETLFAEDFEGMSSLWRDNMRAALTAALALLPKGADVKASADFRAGAEWAAGIAEREDIAYQSTVSQAVCRGCARAIRTALAALPEGGDGWLPISEHVNDGTTKRCLIAGTYSNGVSYVEESFRHHDGHWNSRKLDPPTHWQPLPAAPQTRDAGRTSPVTQDEMDDCYQRGTVDGEGNRT